MGAIAGIFDPGGEGSRHASDLAVMMGALRHRAPDGSSITAFNCGGLAVGLLRTCSDRPQSADPLTASGIALAGDIRLDERADLIREFSPGSEDVSDGQLVLAAYRRWGRDCLNHLKGDFAFAILDDASAQLFCARDHFGIKPLYFTRSGRRLIFASEVKALLALLPEAPPLDETVMADFAAGAIDDPERTFFEGIRRLPAASFLGATRSEFTITRYWTPSAVSREAERDPATQFRALLNQAVLRRLRGALSPAVMLSGGLDSSSIACVADTLSRTESGVDTPVRTLSMVFDDTPRANERRFIEAVLAQGSFSPQLLQRDDHAPLAGLESALLEQDQPFLAPGSALVRSLYEDAAQQGVRVILDGHGGDEVVSHGFGRLSELAASRDWVALWRDAGGVCELFGQSRLRLFIDFARGFGAGPVASACRRLARWDQWMSRRWSRRPGPGTAEVVEPGLAARTGLQDRRAERLRQHRKALATERTNHLETMTSGLVAYSFEILDKAAAKAGLEARYPFYDVDLVEYSLGLPSERKLGRGWTRLILRQAMENLLPHMIQWRKDKLDFSTHLARGLVKHHAELVEDLLFGEPSSLSRAFEPTSIRQAHANLMRNPTGASGADVALVWRAVIFSAWMRDHQNAASTVNAVQAGDHACHGNEGP
jgi:asparagine synthase (glutamine-hydrolysing)